MSDPFANIMSGFGIADVIDVLIVAFVVYKIIGFIRETRAEQLAKGLIILIVAKFLAEGMNFYTLNWILDNAMQVGLVAIVVVFQPELRRGLEYIGRSKLITKQFAQMNKEKVKEVTSILVKTVDYFSSTRTGALIIIERETTLNDIAETGTELNAEISTELLGNIFYEGAPLHDGAAIIRGEKIFAAGCVLPLTQNKNLSKELGTRHRAGIGITENSDAVSLIVSEETGIISIAIDGKLSRFLDLKTVEKTLLNLYLSQSDTEKKKPMDFIGWLRREERNEKQHDK
ncbi:diadenylate cyclase CdaA [Bacilliculturomica massiliensis]|uniref:diadenylate cyclase CdaA n=1 Tax=Bacilliculturomica massiliensis TaxID=1917867 RepID=UPI001FE2FC72|nr:diadenylate cyclase CdaA [Bacilliculturomica massiliensis]